MHAIAERSLTMHGAWLLLRDGVGGDGARTVRDADRLVADRAVWAEADSVSGYETLSAHFPSGLTDPTLVIGERARADATTRAIKMTPGLASVSQTGSALASINGGDTGSPTRLGGSLQYHRRVEDWTKDVDPTAVVGGPDAQRLTPRRRIDDRRLLIPAILAVVMAMLYVLFRTIAPLLLVAVMVVSALAALGLGGWASVHVLGMRALDTRRRCSLSYFSSLSVSTTRSSWSRVRARRRPCTAHGRASSAQCPRPDGDHQCWSRARRPSSVCSPYFR